MAGPIIRNYKAGSIVYFEKDRAEDIYVLQNGRVILTYMSVDSKMEIKEDVKLGEFFGVKSALGRYPREETAQVIGGASILVFKTGNYEHAVYAYNKYLSHYPGGSYANRAQELSRIAAKSSMFPGNMPELVYEV